VGVDVNAHTRAWERFGSEPGSRPGNVHVEIGSQADPAVFDRIDQKHPGGFDIVFDDGSHLAEHMVPTFRRAWQMVRPGGVRARVLSTPRRRLAVAPRALDARGAPGKRATRSTSSRTSPRRTCAPCTTF